MEVPEKWRGKRTLNGEYIYGTLLSKHFGLLIYDGRGYAKVEPQSLCKLAGYDENGNEVYRSYKK